MRRLHPGALCAEEFSQDGLEQGFVMARDDELGGGGDAEHLDHVSFDDGFVVVVVVVVVFFFCSSFASSASFFFLRLVFLTCGANGGGGRGGVLLW